MTPAELRSKNMIAAAVAQTAGTIIKPPTLTPEQECLERANARRHQAAVRFAKMLKDRPSRPRYNEAVEEVYPILRQEFNDWSKDDFATLACMMMAINAAETLRNEGLI